MVLTSANKFATLSLMKRNDNIQNDEAGYVFGFSKQRAHTLGLTTVTAVAAEIQRRQKEAHDAAQEQWSRFNHITERLNLTPQEKIEVAAWKAGWVGEQSIPEWLEEKQRELQQVAELLEKDQKQ